MADRFDQLDPALKRRIRRSLVISSVWFGMVVVSAGVFVLSKPYLDHKREARKKHLEYKAMVATLKASPPAHCSGIHIGAFVSMHH